MYNSNIPLECTQLNDFHINPHYVNLYFLISGKVTSLAFSSVHPAALVMHAFNDFPLVNRVLASYSTLLHVLAIDSILLHEPSHVDPMRHINLSIKKYLYHLL